MTHFALLRIAASGLVMSAALSGCSGVDLTRLSPASSADKLAASADKASGDYQRLANRGDKAGALVAAETAVAADPDNAGYRTQLGHAYFAAGRFASAQTAFEDAMALGASDGGTAVSLALALSANGRINEAVNLLDANRSRITESDYGLALALAGQPERAIMVLTHAARAEGATAQTRQNLAFAHAMTGRWLEAKLIAAQDMSIANLDARMTEWAALVQAPTPNQLVAGLLGVTPTNDPGLPTRLALVDAPGAQQALAREAVVDMASYNTATDSPMAGSDAALAELAPVQVAAAQPMLTTPPAMQVAAAQPSLTTEVQAKEEPYRQAVAELLALNAPVAPVARERNVLARVAAAAPVVTPNVALSAAANPSSSTANVRTGWAVQLGAFSTEAAARKAWTTYGKRFGSLDGYSATSHHAVVSGKNYFRLTANGLGTRQAAVSLCSAVKRSGGVCFVRNLSGREDVRWASRGSDRTLAAR